MLIYNYDPVTHEYTTTGEAERNPVNPDNPIIPACATAIVPLEVKEKFAIVWVGNKWEYKEDHRGETWYNATIKKLEVIDFIGVLPEYYFTPDSPIANPPEGDYWEFDSEKQVWVGNALLYKQYVLNSFSSVWEVKQNTPYEFEGNRYIPAWRDLYNSIYSTLKDGIKTKYRLQDYDGKFVTVDVKTMKPIYAKMADVLDNMYIDKQDLEEYFKKENNFDKLQKKFNEWLNKVYLV